MRKEGTGGGVEAVMLQTRCHPGVPLRFSDPLVLFSSTSHGQAEPGSLLRALPGKQASRAAGGGAQGWKADYMSLPISHTSKFPKPPREGRINSNFEEKPKAKINTELKGDCISFSVMGGLECLTEGQVCLPVRYISSPSVNIWWQRTHLAQVGW